MIAQPDPSAGNLLVRTQRADSWDATMSWDQTKEHDEVCVFPAWKVLSAGALAGACLQGEHK